MSTLSEDGSGIDESVPCVIRKSSSLMDITTSVADIITSKSRKGYAEVPGLSHVNLVIHDVNRQLAHICLEHFHEVFFRGPVAEATAKSGFREIYYITFINGEQGYVPLKVLLLYAEYHLFTTALLGEHSVYKLPPDADILAVFASYLSSLVVGAVLFSEVDEGFEIVYGDAVLVIAPDYTATVELREDAPLPRHHIQATAALAESFGGEFFSTVGVYKAECMFTVELWSPIPVR